MSNLAWMSALNWAGASSRAKPTPEAPGPPGLTSSTPTRRSGSVALRRATARSNVSPAGCAQSMGSRRVPHSAVRWSGQGFQSIGAGAPDGPTGKPPATPGVPGVSAPATPGPSTSAPVASTPAASAPASALMIGCTEFLLILHRPRITGVATPRRASQRAEGTGNSPEPGPGRNQGTSGAALRVGPHGSEGRHAGGGRAGGVAAASPRSSDAAVSDRAARGGPRSPGAAAAAARPRRPGRPAAAGSRRCRGRRLRGSIRPGRDSATRAGRRRSARR